MNLKHVLILIIFALPALIWWFAPGYVVDGTDITFPLNPQFSLQRSFFAWDNIDNAGSYQTAIQLNLARQPIHVFLSFLSAANLPIWDISKIWYFTLLFLSGVTFYFFIHQLRQWITAYKIHPLFCALFYMYNPYFMQLITDQAMMLAYVFVPLLAGLCLHALRKRKIFPDMLWIGITWFFYSPVNPNSFASGLLLLIMILVMAGFHILKNGDKEAIRFAKTFYIILALTTIIVNARIILPYWQYLAVDLTTIQEASKDWLSGVSKQTTLTKSARLIGAWDWFENFNGEAYTPYAVWYQQFVVKILTMMLPLLVFWAMIKGRDKFTWFFGGLAVVGIIFSTGIHPPLGFLYQFFYDHVPGFWIFRSPWYKFSLWITFSYAFFYGKFATGVIQLLGAKTVRLVDVLMWKKRALIYAFVYAGVILYLIVIAWPLFSGWRFTRQEERRGNLPATQVKIPAYVFQTADFINNQEIDGSIILIPQVVLNYSIYFWGYGNLQPPIFSLLAKNSILYVPFDPKRGVAQNLSQFKEYFYEGLQYQAQKFANLTSSNFIIFQKDFNYLPFRVHEDKQFFQSRLDNSPVFEKIASFGEWSIYKNPQASPLLYGAPFITVPEKLSDLANIPTERLIYAPYDQLPQNAANIIKISSQNADLSQFKLEGNQLVSSFQFSQPQIGILESPKIADTKLFVNGITYAAFINDKTKAAYLPAGVSSISTPIKLSENMVKNSNFDSGLANWEFANLSEEITANMKKYFQTTAGQLTLYSPGKNLGIFQYIKRDDDSTRYVISFDFNKPDQSSSKIVLYDDIQGEIVSDVLPPGGTWQSYQKIVRLDPTTKKFSINFFSATGQESTFSIRNLQIRKIITPLASLQFYAQSQWDNIQKLASQPAPKITISSQDKTSVDFEVKSDGPAYLVFNQTYHPLWKLSGNYPDPIDHFIANGFGNGYYLAKGGDYHLKLEFAGQANLILGWQITIVGSFVLLAIYLVLAVKSRRLI